MTKRYSSFLWLFLCFFLTLISASGTGVAAQAAAPGSAQDDATLHILVNVNLVQLNVAVTDRKGNYVTGLLPENFVITEDKIPEKIATFEEGNGPTLSLVQIAAPDLKPAAPASGQAPAPVASVSSSRPPDSKPPGSKPPDPVRAQPQKLGTLPPGANVFILFDTSNYMYRGFVFAQDAIADFVRSLGNANKVALYSYSRDLSREAAPTSDRSQVLRGLRNTVAGANSALYDSLLLTVEDAARYMGRKVVVVFSNGPDDGSLVPPEDVAELAQSTGTIIYMIGTQQAQLEPESTNVFERISKVTGGRAYFAKSWSDERRVFASIRDDLAHLYSLSYYPQANPNRGWRAITVKLVGENLKKDHLRTRDGYRLQAVLGAPGDIAVSGAGSAEK